MIRTEFIKLWEKYEDEYLKFEKVEPKFSQRADIHAFILLDKLCPGTQNIVGSATHYEFYLRLDVDDIIDKITEEDIITLIRCGISYCENIDVFYKFY